MAASMILFIAGVIFCLFGYAVYRLWAAFSGLLTGLIAGIWLEKVLHAGVWPVVAGITLGLILAGIFYYFQPAGAVFAGAECGFLLALMILYAGGSSNWPLALLGAVFAGACTGLFFQPFILAGTAVGGALAALLGLYALLTRADLYQLALAGIPLSDQTAGIILVSVILAAAIGASVQFLLLRRRQRAAERQRRQL